MSAIDLLALAERLTDAQRAFMHSPFQISTGHFPSTVAELNNLELLHLDVTKGLDGRMHCWKSRPTALGAALKASLENGQ